MVKFYPKVDEFPDDILCPLCINQERCQENGYTCETLDAMSDEMESGT